MKRILIMGAAVAAVVAAGAWGVTKLTTDQANIVAAPVAINLAGVSAANGTSRSFATSDHVHSISGLLPAANVSKDATLAGTTTLGIDLTHANTWTGAQTFTPSSGITTFGSSGSTRGQFIATPMASDPSAPSDGEFYVAGTTTAMHAGVRLNGAKQGLLARGVVGSSAVQTVTASGCTTAATAGAVCNTTMTWGTAFPDASYRVVCGYEGGSGIPTLGGVNSKVAASFTVSTIAVTASAATATTIVCLGIHD